MASSVGKVIKRSVLVLVAIGVVVGLRTAVFTTYYLGDAEAVHLSGLEPRTLLFVSKLYDDVRVADDVIYQDPLMSGATERRLVALGRCLAVSGGVYHLNDSTELPVPLRGEEVTIDSTNIERLIPLLLTDMGGASNLRRESFGKHRFSRDYYLLNTVGGGYVWIGREHIVGRVVGAIRSPF